MTVYILWYLNFDSEWEFVGVFSSEAKAQEKIECYSNGFIEEYNTALVDVMAQAETAVDRKVRQFLSTLSGNQT